MPTRTCCRACATGDSRQAEEQRQPAFCVLTDATLLAIAERKPTSREQLATISGVGKAKLDKYGPDVLDLIRQDSVG